MKESETKAKSESAKEEGKTTAGKAGADEESQKIVVGAMLPLGERLQWVRKQFG